MSEILSNTGVKLWAETDYNELWLTVFDQLTGQGGKSNIRLIDEAIGKINATLDGYKFEFSSDEDRLYISKGDSKLPVSLIDSNGHVASKVDGTTITIDESGVVKGIPVDDALSEESTNPLQNKVIAGELKSIKSKMGTDESTIQNNTKRIEANETAISTLNGTGDGSVKKAVSDGIAEVVSGAPEDFDTLKEMSDWINSHESSASAMNSQIQDNKKAIDNHVSNGDLHVTPENKTNWNKVSEKLDKTGDASNVTTEFTTATTRSNLTTKEKLSTSLGKIAKWFSDLKTVAFSGSYNDLSNKPTSLPASDVSAWAKASTKPTYTKSEVGLGNVDNTADANKSVKHATSADNATTVNGHTVNSNVPANAKFTDTTYGVATTTKTGLVKPDGTTITADEDGTLHGVAKITVDTALSSTSTNPVQNKVVKAYVDENVDFSTSTSKLLNDTVEAPLVLSNATRNLVNPTLQTTTQNGVTCTNNGDGTYTLNGTASSNVYFNLGNVNIIPGNKYMLCCTKSDTAIKAYMEKGLSGYEYNTLTATSSIANVTVSAKQGVTISNVCIKPMLTTDLNATYDDFVPYSGYDIKTCGKNLFNPNLQTKTQNGVTCTNNGDGTYTLNGTPTQQVYFHIGTVKLTKGKTYKIVASVVNNKNTFAMFIQDTSGAQTLWETDNDGIFTVEYEDYNILIRCYNGNANNILFKPMITTDLSATYNDFEQYNDGGTVHIDSSTEFPLLGLKSFDGETNIISPGNVEVTYAKSDSGAAIIDMSEKSVKDARKDTTVNLLKPTLKTSTFNGITCTDNGDGTYTFNGTATEESETECRFDVQKINDIAEKNIHNDLWLVGCPKNGGTNRYRLQFWSQEQGIISDTGTGVKINMESTIGYIGIAVVFDAGVTVNNLVFKPMLTTNLSATYDDFVPYTGDTGRLNGDVAELNKTVDTLKKSVSDGKTKVANAITDKGVETATDATFDVMAENISKIETGGGELHGATLAVSTSESVLFGKTVTLTLNGANVGTTVFASNGTCSFVVQNPGTYTITCGEAHKDVTVTGDNVINKTVISVELSLLKIVAFAAGTDEEISAMIQAHYDNKINIADYWAVGDTRTVHLSAMSATGVGESHRAQTVQFVIGDFNHDDLTTPINGHTKAAVTLLQKDCLMDASNASNPVNGVHNNENGYMNSTNTNIGGWKNCARRTWCNNVYFSALPSVWQSMVKTVNKKTSVGNNQSTIETVQDKIFLAAEIEIFGSTTYSVAGEGTQYQYYKNATANIYKMPKWNSACMSNVCWERSPLFDSDDCFCIVNEGGGANFNRNDYGGTSGACGIAPNLCI